MSPHAASHARASLAFVPLLFLVICPSAQADLVAFKTTRAANPQAITSERWSEGTLGSSALATPGVGVASIVAVDATTTSLGGGDQYENAIRGDGKAIFFNVTTNELLIDDVAGTIRNFGHADWTINLDGEYLSFGVAFADRSGTTIRFTTFQGATQVGTIDFTYPGGDPGLKDIYAVSENNVANGFDRVLIQALTADGGGGWGIDNLTVNPVPVPEPSTLILLGLTVAGAASHRWRRRKTT